MLIDSIETSLGLFLPLASHFEGVTLLLFKKSKKCCQSSAQLLKGCLLAQRSTFPCKTRDKGLATGALGLCPIKVPLIGRQLEKCRIEEGRIESIEKDIS